eukprot:1726379-Karenia_brevis.AAC.1
MQGQLPHRCNEIPATSTAAIAATQAYPRTELAGLWLQGSVRRGCTTYATASRSKGASCLWPVVRMTQHWLPH